MNQFSKFLFVFATVVVLGIVAMVSRQTLLTPREVLREVRTELSDDAYDAPRILRRLGNAIRHGEARDITDAKAKNVCAELRLTRAELLIELGATGDARADLEKILKDYRPGNSEVRRLLIRIDSAEGDIAGALERLELLLEDEPHYGPAWVESGRLHQLLADETLAIAKQQVSFVLVVKDAKLAEERLESLTARAATDPLRTSDILRLRELFPPREEEVLAQVLELCEAAGQEVQLARQDFLTSMEFGLFPGAVHGYLAILLAARRGSDAIHFGTLCSHSELISLDSKTGELLIGALAHNEDWKHAAELSFAWMNNGQHLEPAFLELMCHAMYKAERWAGLVLGANHLAMVGSTEQAIVAGFYRGLGWANAAKPNLKRAFLGLRTFASSHVNEPFPGARALAWARLADLHRDEGDTLKERATLGAALTEDPGIDGQFWLRRATIQLEARHSGYQLPLESWTQAMSRLPQRTVELMPTFLELGQKALLAQDRDVQVIYADLKRKEMSLPRRSYGPFVLLQLAQLHGQAGDTAAQAVVATRLLDQYPGFLPALDQIIVARESEGNRRKFVERVVQRAELVGLDARTLQWLDTVAHDEFKPEQTIRMMQVDTGGNGRLMVAQWQEARGDIVEALATLGAPNKVQRGERELLLGARIEIEQGHYQEALIWLDAMPEDGVHTSRRLELSLLSALQVKNPRRIRSLAAEIVERTDSDPLEILRLANIFLRLGHPNGVLELLDKLEESAQAANLDLPTGALLLGRALALLSKGDQAEAQQPSEEIARAESFLSETEGAALRLLADSQRADREACADTAAYLLERDASLSEEATALLFLFTDREEEARDMADFALELVPESLTWALVSTMARMSLDEPLALPAGFGSRAAEQTQALFATGQDAEDSRLKIAALLFAEASPVFHPYLQSRWRDLHRTKRGTFWPRLKEAAVLEDMGLGSEARPKLETLALTFRDCLVVWERYEDSLARSLGSGEHPKLASVHSQRLVLVARAYPGGAEAALLAAKSAMDQEQWEQARDILSAQLREHPGSIEPLALAAQVQGHLGQWTDALDMWRAVMDSPNRTRARRQLSAMIAALAEASRSAPASFTRAAHVEELEQLAAAWPRDPRPTLALARLDRDMDPANPSLGAGRALARLFSFRRDSGGQSLESLQRGSTRAWAEFFVAVDPGSAEDFLSSELEAQPGNIVLWRLLGQVHRELGRLKESQRLLTIANKMTQDAGIQLELARTALATGSGPRTIARSMRGMNMIADAAQLLQGRLILNESVFNQHEEGGWEGAIAQLTQIRNNPAHLTSAGDRAALATLLARGLLLRDAEGDAVRTQAMLSTHLEGADPLYQRETMEVLINLARARMISP
jgi:hypothetical protein